jgi:hypothetical protein
MLITTIDSFIKFIPTANGTEFSAIQPFISQAENEIKGFLIGNDLYNWLLTESPDSELILTASRLICFKAYLNAIPFVDLIQTPNGFGVVSNSNVAPASKERVERLIAWCNKSIDTNSDLLLIQIFSNRFALTEWTKFNKFKTLTSCFFSTGIDFAQYSKSENANRADFLKTKSTLLAAQKNDLSEAISAVFVNELIDQIRTATVTEKNEYIIENCKLILGKFADKNENEADKLLNNLIVYIEKNITHFPTYANSAEYALKNIIPYANQKTDPTFFFGMG